MKLFKWNSELKPVFPNLIEKFLGKRITDGASQNEEVSTVPSVNISDANKAFEVNVALPGLEKKDIKLEVKDNCLIISSEKQYEKEDKTKDWVRKEFGYASFQRMFELPESADHNQVQSQMKNGVLSIKIAKKPGFEDNVKRIAIS